jgi:hypothetical protein
LAKITSTKQPKVAKQPATKRGAAKAYKPREAAKPPKAGKKRQSRRAAKPILLAGGNPQIAKADGDAPVQTYIQACPGWKRDAARRLDALITRTVPGVRKAVKWNSPFYGVDGRGWFLSYHCFANYIKVTFFGGSSLRPVLPIESKHPEVRYFHVQEDAPFDEARFTHWVEQASQLPGQTM